MNKVEIDLDVLPRNCTVVVVSEDGSRLRVPIFSMKIEVNEDEYTTAKLVVPISKVSGTVAIEGFDEIMRDMSLSDIYGNPVQCALHGDDEKVYFTLREVEYMIKTFPDTSGWDIVAPCHFIDRNGHGFVCRVAKECVDKLKEMIDADPKET